MNNTSDVSDYALVSKLRLIMLNDELQRALKRQERWRMVRSWSIPAVSVVMVIAALWEIFRW